LYDDSTIHAPSVAARVGISKNHNEGAPPVAGSVRFPTVPPPTPPQLSDAFWQPRESVRPSDRPSDRELPVGLGLADGATEPIGVAVGLAIGVAVGLAIGVAVGLGLADGATEPIGVAVGLAIGVAVGLAIGVAVGLAIGVAVGLAIGVLEPVGEGETVGEGDAQCGLPVCSPLSQTADGAAPKSGTLEYTGTTKTANVKNASVLTTMYFKVSFIVYASTGTFSAS